MTQTFFIPGPLPGMNDFVAARASFGRATGTGHRWNAYSSMKKEWHNIIFASAHAAGIHSVSTPVSILFAWVERDKRRDPDNIRAAAKLVLDGLVECCILPNDSQQWVTQLTDTYSVDKSKPGVWVTLTPSP